MKKTSVKLSEVSEVSNDCLCRYAGGNNINSLESTGDNGRQPPLLPPRLRATRVDTIIHNYRLSAAPNAWISHSAIDINAHTHIGVCHTYNIAFE